MDSFCPLNNSMRQHNFFHSSILRIRSALPHSDQEPRMRMPFLTRSKERRGDSFVLEIDVDLVAVSHLEMFLPDDVDLASLKEARSIVGDLPVFWEAPPDRAEQTVALLAEHNSDEDTATFGYKLRTGGVTADAFPTSAQIASALVTPATHQLPIKFTAGLHHPIRQFRDEVKTKMHGFLNVLGAAVLAAEHQWDADQAAMMLEDEDAALVFVYRRFFRLARLENRHGTPAIPPQIRDVVRQLQLR